MKIERIIVKILYNEGISKTGDIIDMATELGIVKKGGAWFTYGEDRIQGREQFRQKLIEFPEMYKSIEKEIKTKLGLPGFKDDTVSEEKTDDKPKGKKK